MGKVGICWLPLMLKVGEEVGEAADVGAGATSTWDR